LGELRLIERLLEDQRCWLQHRAHSRRLLEVRFVQYQHAIIADTCLFSYVEPWGPYTAGAAAYLDAAIDWARQTGLKVVIDLHGAPKSQNGFDHSGHTASWPAWGDSDSLSHTHAALSVIQQKYAVPEMQDVVVAIQFLNEPFLLKLDREMVKQFYNDAYYSLRDISDTPAILHDGFENLTWLNGFLTPEDNDARNVIVDHHEYQIFASSTNAMSIDQHIALACDSVRYKLVPSPH
jgi:glucan 1,3-beta-glucosidase